MHFSAAVTLCAPARQRCALAGLCQMLLSPSIHLPSATGTLPFSPSLAFSSAGDAVPLVASALRCRSPSFPSLPHTLFQGAAAPHVTSVESCHDLALPSLLTSVSHGCKGATRLIAQVLHTP